MKKRVEIKVHGRVQGVFFRASTRDKALELNICGTVENLNDGTVRIDAEGDESNMNDFVAWCREGPRHARVDDLKISELPVLGYDKFSIKRF